MIVNQEGSGGATARAGLAGPGAGSVSSWPGPDRRLLGVVITFIIMVFGGVETGVETVDMSPSPTPACRSIGRGNLQPDALPADSILGQ